MVKHPNRKPTKKAKPDRKIELIKQNQTLVAQANQLRTTVARLEQQMIFNSGKIALLEEMEKKKEPSPHQA